MSPIASGVSVADADAGIADKCTLGAILTERRGGDEDGGRKSRHLKTKNEISRAREASCDE
jgi:hypothetical protein